MSLRFQKRVRLFPGVRLNFSGSGVSASFGVRGASVTVGKSGTYLNLGLPGSGLSYRTRIDKPVTTRRTAVPADAPNPVALPPLEDADVFVDGLTFTGKRVFQSGHPDTLSSESLRPLADLASEAGARRARISAAIAACSRRTSWGRFFYGLGKFFLFRPLFTRPRIEKLAAAIAELQKIRTTLGELLEAAVIDIDFGFSEATKSAYSRGVEAFRSVTASEAIWDIPTSYDVNRYTTRSAAAHSLTLKPVKLSTSSLDEFGTDFPAMRFGNANGADLFLLPGFIALRRSGGGLALIDLKDLSIDLTPLQFIESGRRPRDAQQVGEAWAKSNKDGSRDRRFKGNHRIPIMQYGDVRISSTTGLNERYMVSNWQALEAFKASLKDYLRALGKERNNAEGGSAAIPFDEIPDLTLPELPRLPWLAGLATALRVLVLLLMIGCGSVVINGGTVPLWATAIWSKIAGSWAQTTGPAVPGNTEVKTSARPKQEAAPAPLPSSVPMPEAAAGAATPASPNPANVKPSEKAAPAPATKPAVAEETLSAAEVTELQKKLESLGYFSGSANGWVGQDTIAAFNTWRSETGRATVSKITRSDLRAFIQAISR